MPAFFLIGFMGSGKTTLGRALGRAASIPFVDLDEEVERRAGMSVSDIFATRGEAAFRALERDTLAEVARTTGDIVVGCGGGTPCQPGNMELMNAMGVTVWLQASPGCLFRRLREAAAQRPLIAGKTDPELADFIADTLARRTPFYALARERFDSSRLESDAEIAASVGEFMARFIH